MSTVSDSGTLRFIEHPSVSRVPTILHLVVGPIRHGHFMFRTKRENERTKRGDSFHGNRFGLYPCKFTPVNFLDNGNPTKSKLMK